MLTVQERPSFNRPLQPGVKTQPASAVASTASLSPVQFAGERDQLEIRRQSRPAPSPRKSIISPWFEAGVGAGIAASGFPLHIIPILGNAIAIILHAFGGALMLHALYRGVRNSIKQHQNAQNDNEHNAQSHRSNRFDTHDRARETRSQRSRSPEYAKDAPGLHRDSQGRYRNTLGRSVGNPQLGVRQSTDNGFGQSGLGTVLGSGLGQSLAYGAAAGAASSAAQEGMSHLIHPDHPHGGSSDTAQHTGNTDGSTEAAHDTDHSRAEHSDHESPQDMDSHHDSADSHDADHSYSDADHDYGDSGSFDTGGADFSDVGDGDGIHSLFSNWF